MSHTFCGARTMTVVDGSGRRRVVANPVKVNQSSRTMNHRAQRRTMTRAARQQRALSDWD